MSMHLHPNLTHFALFIWLAVLIVTITDCLRSNNENKPRWIAAILLLPFLGTILYFRFARGRYLSEL
jgi:heme A synthase